MLKFETLNTLIDSKVCSFTGTRHTDKLYGIYKPGWNGPYIFSISLNCSRMTYVQINYTIYLLLFHEVIHERH